MGLVAELIVWFIFEVIFWGIMYWTGYAIAQIVTLGKWKLRGTERDRVKWKEKRKGSEFIVVAVMGALFWIGVCLALIIQKTGP